MDDLSQELHYDSTDRNKDELLGEFLALGVYDERTGNFFSGLSVDEIIRNIDFNDAKLCAYITYLITKKRSDIAELFFYNCLSRSKRVQKLDIGDIKTSDWLTRSGLNSVTSNQTPDIHFLSDKTIFIGDVTVTKNTKNAKATKLNKYERLKSQVSAANSGYTVRDYDFIMDTNLNELRNWLYNLEFEFGVKISSSMQHEFRNNIFRINDVLLEINNNVVDRNQFERTLEGYSNRGEIRFIPDDSIIKEPITTYKSYTPKHTERELFDMIMLDCNKNDNSDNMDELDNVDGIYTQLMNNNDILYPVSREPRTPLQYVFNLDCDEPYNDIELLRDYVNDVYFIENCYLSSVIPTLSQLDKMASIKNEASQRSTVARLNVHTGSFWKKIKEKYGQRSIYFCSKNNMLRTKATLYNLFNEYLEKSDRINVTPDQMEKIKLAAHADKKLKSQLNRYKLKKPVSSIHSKDWNDCYDKCNTLIEYLSSPSKNAIGSTTLHFDIPEGIRGVREKENINMILPIYDRVNKSRGAIMASCVRKWASDCARLDKKSGLGIQYSIPVQGNMIFCTITNTNLARRDPSYNYFTICRYKLSGDHDEDNKTELLVNSLFDGIIREKVRSKNYLYVTSKLFKITLDLLSKLINIDAELRSHCMTLGLMIKPGDVIDYNVVNRESDKKYSVEILSDLSKRSKPDDALYSGSLIMEYLHNYIGPTTLLMTDTHQVPSLILDLMKYVAGINFSMKSSITNLLLDKLQLMMKTNLDIYIIVKMFRFINNNLKLTKYFKNSKIKMTSSGPSDSSYTYSGLFNSFWKEDFIFSDASLYLSECQLMTQMRPKKLYGSQFMDKACYKVGNNNVIMKQEEMETPGSTKGVITDLFKFDNNFSYSTDAVFYTQSSMNEENAMYKSKHSKQIFGSLHELGINNLSMRGSCKLVEDMRTGKGLSETSLYNGLSYLTPFIVAGDTESCKVYNIAHNAKHRVEHYNMAQKDQRFGGRAIGSPDYPTKISLFLNETIYKIISSEQNENLLVRGVNRAQKITAINRDVMHSAFKYRYEHVVHIVMDQSQFSEGDNTNKFIDFIKFNDNIPNTIKPIMINTELKHQNRVQHWPTISETTKLELSSYLEQFNGIRGVAGWVQGMKNIMSTYCHIAAVRWIYKIFKMFYKTKDGKSIDSKDKPFIMSQIVNSDDSYIIVAYDNIEVIKDFHRFLISGKKMLRLVENVKKSYMSRNIGEIIQKYVINGCVENIYGKTVVSCFANNMGVNLSKDVLSSIGSLQTMHKEGTPEILISYMRAELKNQIYNMYNLGLGKFNDLTKIGCNLAHLPCELGGWPSNISTYELVCAGTYSQLTYCNTYFEEHPTCPESDIVRSSIAFSMKKKNDNDNWRMFSKRIKHKTYDDIDTSDMDKNFRLQLEAAKMIEALNRDPISGNTVTFSSTSQSELREMVDIKSEISLTNVGLQDYDGSAARSLINCIGWMIKLGDKQSKTVEKLRSFHYQGSGLSGLFVNRNNIQTAVADLVERIDEYLAQITELGYNKDLRKSVYLNSIAVTQNSCTIASLPIRTSILSAYSVLKNMQKKFIMQESYSVSNGMLNRVLRDPTGRAQLCYSILSNYELETVRESSSKVVNRIPDTIDVVDLSNDLRTVLIEMIKPGFLASQNYTIKAEERLESDIATIKMIYSDWFSMSDDMLPVLVGIYRHHLNIRRPRYIISSRFKSNTMGEYLKNVYENTRLPNRQLVGYIRMTDMLNVKIQGTPAMNENIATITSAYRVMDYMEKYHSMNIIDTAKQIKCKLIIDETEITHNIYELCTTEIKTLFVIYNVADSQNKKVLSFMHYKITNSTSLIEDLMRQEDITKTYIVEQKKIWDNSLRRYIWKGYFEVMLVKGTTVVIVKGEPGNIQEVISNTMELKRLTPILYRLVKSDTFHGHVSPKRPQLWGETTFWNSTNPNTDYQLRFNRHMGSTIVENNEADKDFFMQKKKIGVQLPTLQKYVKLTKSRFASLSSDVFVNWIPFTFDATLRGKSKRMLEYKSIVIKDNRVFGLKTVTKRVYEDHAEKTILVTEEHLLFKYNRSFSTLTTYNLSFGIIELCGLEVNSLNNAGLLKKILTGDLSTISKEVAINYIKEYMPRDDILYEFFLYLFHNRFNMQQHNTFKSTVTYDVINIKIGCEFILEADNYEDNDDEYLIPNDDDDLGVNITMIENRIWETAKEMRDQILTAASAISRTSIGIDMINSCLFSEINGLVDVYGKWIKTINDIKVGSHIKYRMETTMLEQLKQNCYMLYESSNKSISDSMNIIIRQIVDSGLLASKTWLIPSIKSASTNTGTTSSSEQLSYDTPDIQRKLMYEFCKSSFNAINKLITLEDVYLTYTKPAVIVDWNDEEPDEEVELVLAAPTTSDSGDESSSNYEAEASDDEDSILRRQLAIRAKYSKNKNDRAVSQITVSDAGDIDQGPTYIE